MSKEIDIFLTSAAFGVVGASTNREKFGNKVLRCYINRQKEVYAVNPRADSIEGVKCYHHIADLPEDVKSLSMITPPKITEQAVGEVIKKGIRNIWMQPGAESEQAIKLCKEHDINIIAGGPCILVHFKCFEE